MPLEPIIVKRTSWGYDPSYDRCEAFDGQGNQLGATWFEKRDVEKLPFAGRCVSRRKIFGEAIAALIALAVGVRS